MSTTSLAGKLARYASYNVAQQVWLASLSIVATPVLYRALGEEGYGVLAIVSLVAAQLGVIEFGFGHATVRRVAQFRARGDLAEVARSFHTALWVFLVGATIGGSAVAFGAGPLVRGYFRVTDALAPAAIDALRIGALFFGASFMSTFAAAGWSGLQRFDLLNVIGGVSATAQVLGGIVIALRGGDVVDVVVWSAVVATVTVLTHLSLIRRHLPGQRVMGPPNRATFAAMAGFGLVLMLSGILTQVFLSGGPLLLGYFVWVGALPFFTVPFGIFQRLLRMAVGLASALYPMVAELDGSRDHRTLGRVMVSGTRIVAVAAVAAMMPAVLLARPFMELWMGREFSAQAAPVLEMLFVAFVAAVSAVPTAELARGTGRAGRLVELGSVMAAANLAGVALLAPRIGVLGAGLAFLVAEWCGTAYLVARTARAEIGRIVTSRMVAYVAGAAALELVLYEGASGALARLGAAVGVAAVLVAVGYAWVLSDDERHTLGRAIGRSG